MAAIGYGKRTLAPLASLARAGEPQQGLLRVDSLDDGKAAFRLRLGRERVAETRLSLA